MYTPRRYRVDDSRTIVDFIRAHGFATLVTFAGAMPAATHLPLEWVEDPDGSRALEGHFARANPQWKTLGDGEPALAVFLGPHAYVSPTWYDHENVPTWNYQAVHASGRIELVHEPAELLAMVRRLSRHYEPEGTPGGFDVDAMTPRLREGELRGIVGFRLRIERLEAGFKLSQNRDAANRASIIAALRARGDADSAAIAAAMEALEPYGRGPGSTS